MNGLLLLVCGWKRDISQHPSKERRPNMSYYGQRRWKRSLPHFLLLLFFAWSSFLPSGQGTCAVECSDDYCACIADIEGYTCAVSRRISESTPVGENLFNVTVVPSNSTTRIDDGNGVFIVDGHRVMLNASLDYEENRVHFFTIDCLDGGTWSSTPNSLRHKMDIRDENEYPPSFTQEIIYATVKENDMIGTRLITNVPIVASDVDYSDGGFTFYIKEEAPFALYEKVVCTNETFLILDGTLDFEEQDSYNITIVAMDGCMSGFDSLEGYVTVVIMVGDSDDLPPAFTADSFRVSIQERNSSFVYGGISAYDQDTLDAPLLYSFIGQSGDWGCLDYLMIDPVTAIVTLSKELDYETSMNPCIVTVEAVQQDNCEMIAGTNLTVTVDDINECPIFISESYTGQLAYDDPFVVVHGGIERLIITMTDEDRVFHGQYKIEPENTVELLEVKEIKSNQTRSYYIRFLDPISVISDTDIQIFLEDNTADVSCNDISTSLNVSIRLDDLSPNFTQSMYHGIVYEDAPQGTSVLQVTALNSDRTSDGIVYRLQMLLDSEANVFDIDAKSGMISTVMNDSMDAESIKQYELIIEAVDERGTYHRSNVVQVLIDVQDVNEYQPTCKQSVYRLNIQEELSIGVPIITIQVIDFDVESVIEFSIKEPNIPFEIGGQSGTIVIKGRLDRDNGTTVINFTVEVTDGIYENECQVIITLLDINDNAPEFRGEPFRLSVPENLTETATMKIEAIDVDDEFNAVIVYDLESPDDGRFSIINQTGIVYITGPFDYEEVKEYTLLIKASDPDFSTTTWMTVEITDVNDNIPVFTSYCSLIEILEDTDIDEVICKVVAEDVEDKSADAIVYSLDSAKNAVPFAVDNSTGEIKITADLDRETLDNYLFNITAKDRGSPPLSVSTSVTVVILDVNDEDPVFEEQIVSLNLTQEDLNPLPILLQNMKATDSDMPPWNLTLCQKSSGEESFAVLTAEDGSCEIYAHKMLHISADAYAVSFYAFNPDDQTRRSGNVTLYVYIQEVVICNLTFVNMDDYDVVTMESDLDTSKAIVTLEITSNCNTNDVLFGTLRQSHRFDVLDVATPSEEFTLSPNTGEIFPRETVMTGEHIIVVNAFKESDVTVNETATVRILVVVAENQPPTFHQSVYKIDVTSISMVIVIDLSGEASDPDYPSFATGQIVFSELSEADVDSGIESDYFDVSPNGVVSTTSDSLSLINLGNFILNVLVMDQALQPLFDTAAVLIYVDIDKSDPIVSPPVIIKDCDDSIVIEEELDPPILICNVGAIPSGDEQIIFGLDSSSEYFEIDPSSGEITTVKKFNYEVDKRSYSILVYAEGTTSNLRNYSSIAVIITDVNDNAPDFSESQLHFSMEENKNGSTDCVTFIGVIKSSDADSETNQHVTYATVDPDFEVYGNNLTAVRCISRNSNKYYDGVVNIVVVAHNVGFGDGINQTTSVVITVTIEDLNDNAPVFVNDPEEYIVDVEVLEPDLLIFIARAEDYDKGPYNNALVFAMPDGQEDVIYSLFKMSLDGLLTMRDVTVNDQFVTDVYEVIVMASDMGHPPLNSSEVVSVYVAIGDLITPYFPVEQRTQTVKVSENNEEQCEIFPTPRVCNASDVTLEYELMVTPESGAHLFYINATTNELCVRSGLDRETSSSYTILLTAHYADPDICNLKNRKTANMETESNVIIYNIIVVDVIDTPPYLQFPSNNTGRGFYLALIDSSTLGSHVFNITAIDKDAESNLSYSLTSSAPPGSSPSGIEDPRYTIVIDKVTGQITTNTLLYPWLSDSVLWEWDDSESNFPRNRTEDPYRVTVCDDLSPNNSHCVDAPLTFKILLSFEHIIIRVSKPITSVIPNQNELISCIARKMDPDLNLELYLQFLSPTTANGNAYPDQQRTDMWVYGVNASRIPLSPYLKFDDFKSIWDKTAGLEDCSDVVMEATRLQLSEMIEIPSSMLTRLTVTAYVSVALSILVFIGSLISLILLATWEKNSAVIRPEEGSDFRRLGLRLGLVGSKAIFFSTEDLRRQYCLKLGLDTDSRSWAVADQMLQKWANMTGEIKPLSALKYALKNIRFLPDDILEIEAKKLQHILVKVGNEISKSDELRKLGFELNIQLPTIKRAMETNYRGPTVSSEGSIDMLQNWAKSVKQSEVVPTLRKALKNSELISIEETCLPEPDSEEVIRSKEKMDLAAKTFQDDVTDHADRMVTVKDICLLSDVLPSSEYFKFCDAIGVKSEKAKSVLTKRNNKYVRALREILWDWMNGISYGIPFRGNNEARVMETTCNMELNPGYRPVTIEDICKTAKELSMNKFAILCILAGIELQKAISIGLKRRGDVYLAALEILWDWKSETSNENNRTIDELNSLRYSTDDIVEAKAEAKFKRMTAQKIRKRSRDIPDEEQFSNFCEFIGVQRSEAKAVLMKRQDNHEEALQEILWKCSTKGPHEASKTCKAVETYFEMTGTDEKEAETSFIEKSRSTETHR